MYALTLDVARDSVGRQFAYSETTDTSLALPEQAAAPHAGRARLAGALHRIADAVAPGSPRTGR